MRKLIIVLFLVAIAKFSFSQISSLQGTVIDEATGEPLISATVRVGNVGAICDIYGNFSLQLEQGEYEVLFSYVGYETVMKKVNLNVGDTLNITVPMALSANLLKTATITSGKYEKPLAEVTVSLDVIKPALLESTNAISVDNVLEMMPGVSIIDGQPNIRGGSGYSYGAGSRVLLLVDDLPILTPDAGFPNWSDLPVENISQVEVIKGAASALYGSSAMNGIINVRTAYAKSKPEGKVSIYYTSYLAPADTLKKWWDKSPFSLGERFSFMKKVGKVDLVLGGNYFSDKSFNKDNSNTNGRATVGLRYRISDRTSIGMNSGFNIGNSKTFFFWKNEKEGAYLGFPSTYSTTERLRYNIDPFFHYYGKRGFTHKILTRLYSVNNGSSDDRANQSKSYYGEYQVQKQFEETNFVVSTGVVMTGIYSKAELYGDTTYTGANQAVYLQVDKKAGRFNFSSGFRYERNVLDFPFAVIENDTIPGDRSVEAKPVFRVGVNFHAAKYTYFRASWGQGYRYPTIAEKFISTSFGGIPINPNPDLVSETGWTGELGVKQGFGVFGVNGFLDISGFWSQYKDMMEFLYGDFGFQSQNVGGTVIKGFEVSLTGTGKISGFNTNFILGYTFIDPKFVEFDTTLTGEGEPLTEGQINARNSSASFNILKYRSKHTAKFDFEIAYKKLAVGVSGRYYSHVEAIDLIFEALLPGIKDYREKNNKGYKIVDLRLNYEISKELGIGLLINNLFNEEYTVRPGLLEAPRNVTLKMGVKF